MQRQQPSAVNASEAVCSCAVRTLYAMYTNDVGRPRETPPKYTMAINYCIIITIMIVYVVRSRLDTTYTYTYRGERVSFFVINSFFFVLSSSPQPSKCAHTPRQRPVRTTLRCL